ncbi:MAG: aminoglycoside phosphotransferase family protein [Nitrospinales bacterium]
METVLEDLSLNAFFKAFSVEDEKNIAVPVEDPYGIDGDPKLRFLENALSPRKIQGRLQSCLKNSNLGGAWVKLNGIRVTRHKPGRRCLIEYDVVIEPPGRAPKLQTWIGKARARDLDEAAYKLQTALCKKGFDPDSADAISTPMPVGVLPEFNMWLYRKAPGVSCSQRILQPGWEEIVKRIAEGIHKIHRCGVKPQRSHTMDDELRILNERLPLLIPENPQWERRIARILDACARLGAQVPATVPTGIHRDFYPDQVLVDNARIYIIDLDLFSLGDPGLDVGNFIGHLVEQGLRELGDAEALADRQNIFEDHFLRLAGARHRCSVQTYGILTLVRHIYISSLFAERKAFTEPILELCEKRLGLA